MTQSTSQESGNPAVGGRARFDAGPLGDQALPVRMFAGPVVLLLLLLSVVYTNSFHGPFHFDDLVNIVDNPNLQQERLTLESLERAVRGRDPRPGAGVERPVAFLTLLFNYTLNGLEPFGYHLLNFAVHGLCTLVLFFLTVRVLLLTAFGRKRPPAAVIGIALLSSALWASHPIQVTAVTYIVQRMTALAALFSLICMYSYIEARTATGGRGRAGYGAACLVSGLLAIGSKENAAMLPVNLALIEFCLLSSGGRSTRRTFFIAGAAVLLVGGVGLWFTDISSLLAGYQARPFTLSQRLLTEARVFFFYVGLLLYPVSQQFTMLHDIALSTGPGSPWTTAPAVLSAMAIPVCAAFLTRRLPLLSFSILFFWVNHLIEGTIVPLEIVFEHRNYLPSAFFFLPFSAGIAWLLEKYSGRHPLTVSVVSLAVVFLIAQGHTVRMRNDLFSHPLLLWKDNVDKAPALHRPHHNLSNAYFAAGLSDMALFEAFRALEARGAARKGQKYITWYNLGTYSLYKGELSNALQRFEKALEIQPEDPRIYHKLAVVHQINGNLSAAEILARKALQKSGGSAAFLPTFAMILLKQGRIDPVMRIAASQLEQHSAVDQWYYLLGEALRHRGELPRAAAFFEHYRRRVPEQIAPTAALIEIYDRLGRKKERDEAARRLYCLAGGREVADLIEDYHLRYNTLGRARIERIANAFEKGICRGVEKIQAGNVGTAKVR